MMCTINDIAISDHRPSFYHEESSASLVQRSCDHMIQLAQSNDVMYSSRIKRKMLRDKRKDITRCRGTNVLHCTGCLGQTYQER